MQIKLLNFLKYYQFLQNHSIQKFYYLVIPSSLILLDKYLLILNYYLRQYYYFPIMEYIDMLDGQHVLNYNLYEQYLTQNRNIYNFYTLPFAASNFNFLTAARTRTSLTLRLNAAAVLQIYIYFYSNNLQYTS